MKARAKAERAAARNVVAMNGIAPCATPTSAAPSPSAVPIPETPTAEADSVEPPPQDAEDVVPVAPLKESALDRAELLRSKPDVVVRFMQLIVPILVDVYAASVAIPVRAKCLTALLKAISFLDCEVIKRVLKVRHSL